MMQTPDLAKMRARVASLLCDSDREFGALNLATKYGISHLDMMLILKGLEKSEMVKHNPDTNLWRYNNEYESSLKRRLAIAQKNDQSHTQRLAGN